MKTIVAFAVTVLVCLSQGAAFGQNIRADQKPLGSSYRPYTARTYQRHALNHAQVLQYYGKSHTTIPKETAQEHATAVRHNLDLTTKELAKLEPQIKDDKEAQKLVEGIKAHQAKASEHCGMLETECAKHEGDGVKIAGCCADMAKELKAADELHDKLMKHLGYAVPMEHKEKK